MDQDRQTAWRWFGAFTGVFTLLMAYVFWGTWSPDAAPVMPDDGVTHSLSFGTQFRGWFNQWLAGGKFTPADFLWSPLLISKYYFQELKYAASAYCAALGLVYFLRGRGLSRLAAYGAGLFLGFCGYWLTLFSAGHGGWFIWMMFGVAAFGFVDRAVRFNQIKHWILFGATLAWGSFYQPDLWLLFTVLTGFYTLTVCAWEKRFPWKGFLLSSLVFALIGAPSVRQALTNDLAQRDAQIAETAQPNAAPKESATDPAKAKADAEARWIFATNWSLPPSETFEFLIPRLNGDTSCPMVLQLARAAGKDVKPYTGALGRPINAKQGNYRQHSLYVGFVTCLLAILGCVGAFRRTDFVNETSFRARRKFVAFFAAMGVLFWIFSLGRNCECVYRLVYALPFGDYLRAPVKWHHLTEFCLCILAAFGIDTLLRLKALKGLKGSVVVSLLVLIGAADLARVDSLYCGPIDLTLVRGKNAAADFVQASGKGKVADLIERGHGLLAWSFGAHDVEVTGDLNDKDVRFIWVGTQDVARNQPLANFLKARADLVGNYLVARDAIRATAPTNANVALYQMKGVPPPPPAAPGQKTDALILALALVSVVATCGAVGVAGKSIFKSIKEGISK